MSSSIFWHDYETTGIDPRCDRPLQLAGIRTDLDLNEIEAPLNLYCRPSDDILPHPAACLITGITPELLAEHGLPEATFMAQVHAELARPGTCGAGYNTLRFDDEVTRYSLYRNFFDPYGREWQGGNSRWDLIDVVRTAYALRPDGIVWPEQQGRVSLRLELLSQANGLEHGNAHEALSDVRATIALARLIRARQPRLFQWLFDLRRKQRVLDQIELFRPCVHVSGRFGAERHYVGVVLPVAWHPHNRNALIVHDLQQDSTPLMELSAEQLRERLYTRRADLLEGELPVPLKLIHINRCPVVAPLAVIRPADAERLQLDIGGIQHRAASLMAQREEWLPTLEQVYSDNNFTASEDPEQQLYEGFIGERDRRLCDQVRQLTAVQAQAFSGRFEDSRLDALLFRYRARNFPESLSATEQVEWSKFVQLRLKDPAQGAPNTLSAFNEALQQFQTEATGQGQQVLAAWARHGQSLARRYGL